ncbi:MAG: hypothetical protein M3P26_06545 [Gemmatimonadota bacterium]|nr:hypothetical protein [Gemmatimonadota bacterium]
MANITLRIPMISAAGPLQPRQVSREFQGAMPPTESVTFVARIIRDGLETAHYPEYKRLIANSDEWLVQQIALATAVHDDVWIRNGFIPLSEWTPTRGE